MKEFIVSTNEENKTLYKFLKTVLPKAPDSFIYKMLRKKNIKLNNKKAAGNEKLNSGDQICIYLSDDTFSNFSSDTELKANEYVLAYKNLNGIRIIYEDDDIAVIFKPPGILSQKASLEDVSLNEWFIGYLLENNKINEGNLLTFKPSILNRLDRNTRGLVIASKTLKASQIVSKCIKERAIKKYYSATVKGVIKEEALIDGYLYKDDKNNKVKIYKTKPKNIETSYINTYYKPINIFDDRTDLTIDLITGKSHQIRAHLASIGHPLLGDPKYGDKDFNRKYSKKYQELTAYKIVFPEDIDIDSLKGRSVILNGYMEK